MQQVDVVAVVDDTITRFHFTASWVSSQLWDNGRARLFLIDGSDDQGPVSHAQFRQAEVIICRPDRP